jgi:16S rRNA (uracil1498-N3)-methyltransferase
MRHQGRYVLDRPGPAAAGDEFELAGGEARHLLVVRRARPGDRLEVSDGAGRTWRAELVAAGRDTARCRVLEELPSTDAQGPRLSVATAVPRAKRMSFLVEKCAELGVDELLPVAWGRSPRAGSQSALERWRRLAAAAAKQSRRDRLMHVSEPLTPPALGRAAAAYCRVLLLDPAAEALLSGSLGALPVASRVLAVVGPEGGFGPADLADLTDAAGQRLLRVRLGGAVLRVETAAVAVAALFLAARPEGRDE